MDQQFIFMFWIIISLVFGLKNQHNCTLCFRCKPTADACPHLFIAQKSQTYNDEMHSLFESNEKNSEGKGKLCVTKNYEIPYQIEIGFENTF